MLTVANTFMAIVILTLQIWTKLQSSARGPWPVGRWRHAASCIQYGEDRPRLLVTGGVGSGGNLLGDAWLLDVNPGSWKEVGRHPCASVCDCYHNVCSISDLVLNV